jgi:hypothetical protein
MNTQMKGRVNSFIHALKAEWVAGRRTFLRYSPIVFALLTLLIMLPQFSTDIVANKPRLESIAIDFVTNYFWVWIFIMLPFYCIFVAIMNYYTEHGQSLWKHLNVQPVSGTVQALAKHLYAWCYVATATITLSLLIVIVLVIVKMIYTELTFGFGGAALWLTLCQLNLGTIAGGAVVVSILNVLAARFPGFSTTFITGFFGLLLGIFIKIDDPAAPFIPWMFEKVCLHHLAFSDAPYRLWWIAIPIVWIATTLTVHIALQRKKSLY